MSQIPQFADPTIRVAAAIEGVREVTLAGMADLAYWRERLRPRGLRPFDDAGRARLLISATSARWKGLRFCELSFSIAVGDGGDESRHGGFFLAHAYNSRRALAFAERAFFKTPYDHGRLRVEIGSPARVELLDAGVPAFSAAMAGSRPASWSGGDTWEGVIYLPSPGKAGAPGPRFYARLSGDTQVYPFAPGLDTLILDPAARPAIFGQLRESDFAVSEWRVRASAAHLKSQTYSK